jgi:hypothetical protein
LLGTHGTHPKDKNLSPFLTAAQPYLLKDFARLHCISLAQRVRVGKSPAQGFAEANF